MRRRRGFTFIELLVVMIVLSILSGLAILKYLDLKHRALSASATAACDKTWNEIVANNPEPYLPGGFSFSKPEYTLDWDNFVPPGGGPSGGMQLGVVVSSSNPRLMEALQNNLGNKAPFFVVCGTLTFVIVGPDGRI